MALRKKGLVEHLDSRTLLLITIVACFVTFMAPSYFSHAAFTVLLLLLLLLSGYGTPCALFAMTYGGALGFLILGSHFNWIFPSPLFLAMIYKMVMPIIPGYLLNKVPSGRLTAGLRKLPIPQRIFMVVIVMLRFIPTVSQEFAAVREAMRIRGFVSSVPKMLRHPLDTLEYAIVPMVFRSLKISDELSSSAIVRGIEYPGKKSSYYICRFTLPDILIGATVVIAAILCVAVV